MEKSIKNNQYVSIIDKLEELFPNAKCELDYTNIYELLIAVVLSAQTTDVRVNIVTKDLFKKYPTINDLAKAEYNDVLEIIKSLGLSKMKAKNIIELSKMIEQNYQSIVPHEREKLMQLPGVGRKTTNVVLSEGFHIPAIAVDTHVSRIAQRLGFSESDDVFQIEQDLMEKIEKERWHKAHHLMIFFGRYFCKAQRPMCMDCPFKNEICKEKNKNL